MPDRGEAIESSPNMNFEMRSDFAPWRPKFFTIFSMHKCGSCETLQKKCRVLVPHLRPASNQARSARINAVTEYAMIAKKLSLPKPARAPAASNNRFVGRGRQACRPITETNITQ